MFSLLARDNLFPFFSPDREGESGGDRALKLPLVISSFQQRADAGTDRAVMSPFPVTVDGDWLGQVDQSGWEQQFDTRAASCLDRDDLSVRMVIRKWGFTD